MNLRNKFQTSVSVLGVTMALALPVSAQAAGAASFSLAPSAGSSNVNEAFSVSIYENSGAEAVNSLQADVNFDSAKVQLTGFSAGAFTCPITPNNGSSVSIGCALFGGGSVTGGQLVGTLSFKAIAGNGSASISIASSSLIARSSDSTDIWNHAAVGTAVTMTTPAPAPAPAAPKARVLAATTTGSSPTPEPVAAPVVVKREEKKIETPIVLPSAKKKSTPWIIPLVVLLAIVAAVVAVGKRQGGNVVAEEAPAKTIAKAATAAVAAKSATKKVPAAKKKPVTKKI